MKKELENKKKLKDEILTRENIVQDDAFFKIFCRGLIDHARGFSG